MRQFPPSKRPRAFLFCCPESVSPYPLLFRHETRLLQLIELFFSISSAYFLLEQEIIHFTETTFSLYRVCIAPELIIRYDKNRRSVFTESDRKEIQLCIEKDCDGESGQRYAPLCIMLFIRLSIYRVQACGFILHAWPYSG